MLKLRMLPFVLSTLFATLAACTHSRAYVTPGEPADLSAFSPSASSTRIAHRCRPAARFPVNLAFLRVQDASHVTVGHRYGHGRFGPEFRSDIETDEQVHRLASMPEVSGLVRLNRLVLPPPIESEADIRRGAARLRADMVLLYTLDTDFELEGKTGVLGVLTLGLLKNRSARIKTVATAIIVDVQTGFLYGTAEAVADVERGANSYATLARLDEAREQNERDAWTLLAHRTERMWGRIVQNYGSRRKLD